MGRILLLLALVAVALAVQAPAWLLTRNLEEHSGGTLSLRNATGTVWRGEADTAIRGQPAARGDHALGRLAWRVERKGPDAGGYFWSLPVVGETWDGHLNDINGFHVGREHALSLIHISEPTRPY